MDLGAVMLSNGLACVGDTVTYAYGPAAYVIWGTIIRVDDRKGVRVRWDDGSGETWVRNPRNLDSL